MIWSLKYTQTPPYQTFFRYEQALTIKTYYIPTKASESPLPYCGSTHTFFFINTHFKFLDGLYEYLENIDKLLK